MVNIGIISEGITDQIVIEYILVGLLQDDNLSIDPFQPTRDATDEDLATSAGNWDKVFEYCESSRFEYAVLNTDLLLYKLMQIFLQLRKYQRNINSISVLIFRLKIAFYKFKICS